MLLALVTDTICTFSIYRPFRKVPPRGWGCRERTSGLLPLVYDCVLTPPIRLSYFRTSFLPLTKMEQGSFRKFCSTQQRSSFLSLCCNVSCSLRLHLAITCKVRRHSTDGSVAAASCGNIKVQIRDISNSFTT